MRKERYRKIAATFCAATAMCVLVAGCSASTERANYQPGEIHDPYEDFNRTMFDVHNAVDQAVLEPAARGYRAITPKLVRDGVTNILRNLRSPVNMANNLLQGNIEGAAGDLSRAVINTSFGLGGFLDIAADTGLEYKQNDFGQTLAVWGVDHGPYLFIPVWGPSSARDLTGLAVDSFADPLRLYLFNTDREIWHYGRMAATGIDTRESLLDALDDLRRNSFDYYAAVRSAYYQRRQAMINANRPAGRAAAQASSYEGYPDYDEWDW